MRAEYMRSFGKLRMTSARRDRQHDMPWMSELNGYAESAPQVCLEPRRKIGDYPPL